jgi:signal transduction histidine kinase
LFQARQHEVAIVSSYRALYVDGDMARLVQCVVNILTNAAKYTDSSGKIRVETRAEGSEAVITVSDSGAGISPELLPRVFDLFVQGERTLDRSLGGLGIGSVRGETAHRDARRAADRGQRGSGAGRHL